MQRLFSLVGHPVNSPAQILELNLVALAFIRYGFKLVWVLKNWIQIVTALGEILGI